MENLKVCWTPGYKPYWHQNVFRSWVRHFTFTVWIFCRSGVGGERVRAMTAEWQLEVKWFLIRELSTLAVFVSCYKRTELDADMPASLSFLVCTDGLHLFLLRKTFVLFCFYLGRFRLTKILAKNKQSKRGEWNTSISFSFPAWISFPLYLLYLGSDLFENIARKDNSLEAKKLYEFFTTPCRKSVLNRPFSDYFVPLSQNEASCKAFRMKMCLNPIKMNR